MIHSLTNSQLSMMFVSDSVSPYLLLSAITMSNTSPSVLPSVTHLDERRNDVGFRGGKMCGPWQGAERCMDLGRGRACSQWVLN